MRHFIFWAVTGTCILAIGVAYLGLGSYFFASEYRTETTAERFVFFGALYIIAFCASNGIGIMIPLAFKESGRDSNPSETVMAASIITLIIFLAGGTFIAAMSMEMTDQSIIAGVGAMMLSNVLAIRFAFEGGKQLSHT